MAVGDAHVFPSFLTPVLTQLFFPKPPTTFLTCFCRGERRKYAGKKSRLNRGSNSQPPDHESDTLTTEPSGRGSFTVKTSLDCSRWDWDFPFQLQRNPRQFVSEWTGIFRHNYSEIYLVGWYRQLKSFSVNSQSSNHQDV